MRKNIKVPAIMISCHRCLALNRLRMPVTRTNYNRKSNNSSKTSQAECEERKHYRNMLCKTRSRFSANGSTSLSRPRSSKRGGSSIVASDPSEPGDSSRWCLFRSLPDSLETSERSSLLRRLDRLCSWSSRSSCSLSGVGSRAGSSCGFRSNLTLFSSSGAELELRDLLELRDFSTTGGPVYVSVTYPISWAGNSLNPPRAEV